MRQWFDAAVAAASAPACLPAHLPPPPAGDTVVVGAGKAAAAMARALECHWPASAAPPRGLVVTRYGHGVATDHIEVVEAAHPVPDAAGRAATARIVAAVGSLGADDLVVCLLSGGGSALLSMPPPWLEFAEKQRLTTELLRSGAPIAEINCVRKHLSAVKGGRLATAAAPAAVVALLISDVPGDDPAVIASGPTVADPTTSAEALAILDRHGIAITARLRREIANHETPKSVRSDAVVVATPRQSLAAAAAAARAAGVHCIDLGAELEGDAVAVAHDHAARVRRILDGRATAPRPCVLLSGGETTVTVAGDGRGGRNTHYLLALAVALDGAAGVAALAADTDGIDGTEDNAGATISPDTLARARAAGLDVQAHLAHNDAYSVFAALGDLVVTGPTRTNVNDFRAILVS